eukprot:1157233-Pelagomonas_calceolata.AAC.2
MQPQHLGGRSTPQRPGLPHCTVTEKRATYNAIMQHCIPCTGVSLLQGPIQHTCIKGRRKFQVRGRPHSRSREVLSQAQSVEPQAVPKATSYKRCCVELQILLGHCLLILARSSAVLIHGQALSPTN